MPDEPKPSAAHSYAIGNVGAQAQVVQGNNNTVSQSLRGPADGELAAQFDALLARIAKDPALDDDTRALAEDKTRAVAAGLAQAEAQPGLLRRALIDAGAFFGSAATGIGRALGDILKSDAAQKTIGAVTEAATKAAIASFLK